MQEKYGKQGFVVISVHSWDKRHSVPQVKEWVESQKLKQTVLVKGASVAEETFGVTISPTNFWIDHEGKIVGRKVSFLSTPVALRAMATKIEQLLAKRKRAAP